MNGLLRWTDVCARRLARHGLASHAAYARPADVVAAMAGTHAQVASAAELAIGLRLEPRGRTFTRADVRAALWEDGTLVKTFGPRGTVHLLPARDLPRWVAALAAVPVAPSTFPDGVRMTAGQTEDVLAAIEAALRDAELTIDELGEAVVSATGPWAGDLVMPAFQGMWPRWRQVLHLAGMRGVLCFGPGRGRKVTYTSPRQDVTAGTRDALAHVLKSYLHAYGPGTPQRFAHWLNAPVRWAAGVFDDLAGELEPVEVEGDTAWVTAGDTAAPPERPQGVRLLPYFDGYAYRVGNQPPELLYPGRAAQRVLRANFQARPRLTIGAVTVGGHA